MSAEETLNTKWDALSERFNLLKSVPADSARTINAAISQWQDWYWGRYGDWPPNELIGWQEKYLKAAALLDAVAAKTVAVASVKQTDDYIAPSGKVTTLPPLLVTARAPEPVYVAPAPVIYEEQPYESSSAPATPYTLDLGPTVGSWGTPEQRALTTYDVDPGTTGWTPTPVGGRTTRAGLAALVVSVAATIAAKRYGWI